MAGEFESVAGSGKGLEGLSDGVLQTPIFERDYSPTFAELLMLAYVGLESSVPQRIVDKVCGDGLRTDLSQRIQQSVTRWNEYDENTKKFVVIKNLTLMDLTMSLCLIDTDDELSRKIKNSNFQVGMIMYGPQIPRIINPMGDK
jgi:hypothetical protein